MLTAPGKMLTVMRDLAYTRVVKLEWLSAADLSVKQDLTVELVAGDVTMQANQESQRTFSLTVKNPAGKWSPLTDADPFFSNHVLRIWLGCVEPGSVITDLLPLGTFRINRSKPAFASGEAVLRVDGQDFWKDTIKGLTGTVRFPAGTALRTILDTLLARANFPVAPGASRWTIDPLADATSLVLVNGIADLNYLRGRDISVALSQSLRDFGWIQYFDGYGVAQAKPRPTPWASAAVYDVQETHASVDRIEGALDDSPDIRNHVGVSSTNPDVGPVFAEVKDENVSSPTWVGGPLGDRYLELELDWIQLPGQALLAAQNELFARLAAARPFTVTHSPYPWLEPYDVVTLTSAKERITADKCWVESMKIPLDGSPAQTKFLEARAFS